MKKSWLGLSGVALGVAGFIAVVVLVQFIPPLAWVRPFTERYLGLRCNWIWPVCCILLAIQWPGFRRGRRNVWLSWGLGLFVGVALQASFGLLGLRRGFRFQGVFGELLLFQALVAFAEERLFRGALQSYLASRLGERMESKLGASLLAGLFISTEFGAVHGLNPLLLGHGGFDWGWFVGTFFLSLLASIAFGLTASLAAPFGIHLAFNYISSFF